MDIEIKKSKIHEKGAFAKRNFKKGEIILKWHPKKLTLAQQKNLTKKQKENTISNNKGEYFFMQSPERFVNHSCEPNTKMNTDLFQDIAIKNIKKGEEITSHYPNPVGKEEICKCGSKKCLGKF